jgi:hypothetical protein
MTFVGKILVIIIMVFALFFLAISTVVFTTETNWKEVSTKRQGKIDELTKNVTTAKGEGADLQTRLAQEQANHKQSVDAWEKEKANLVDESKKRQDEITDQRKLLETALQNTKINGEEADARKKETDLLRGQVDAVQKQSNEYKLAQTELNERIRVLERELNVAKTNNKDLRDRVAVLQTVLRSHNLTSDVDRLTRLDNPPDVEGRVDRIDARNSRVEISIGSDDGLVEGNTLYVYRTAQPDPGYIGRIQIDAVDPDQAVGHVIGRTIQGKKIREGDLVTTKIGPRS